MRAVIIYCMTTKRFILVCILVAGLLLSACQGGAKTPENSLPTKQEDVAGEETLVVEETSTPSIVEHMYPSEGLEVTTAYPAWGVPTVVTQDLQPPLEANTPSSGKASLSGLLYAFNISVPLSNMDFVLMPAVVVDGVARVPPILTYGNPEDGDVLGKTDGNGVFFLDDILPGKYFLVVNYPDHSEIAVDPNNTSAPLMFEFEVDTSYPLGVVLINS